MNETERFAWLQLTFTSYVGAESSLISLRYSGSAQVALDASAEKIAVLVHHRQAAEAWYNVEKRRLTQESAEAALRWETQGGRRLMLLQDQDFPGMLTQGVTASSVLFLRGGAGLLRKYSAAIVGSHHATPQTVWTAKDFSRALNEKGIPIVSGMASGTDATAHQGALQTGGSVIAVWKTGIDHIYPPSNKSLVYEIVEKGLTVSEFPSNTRPLMGNFPHRNRLIAALSQVTLVVEAVLESGSLIIAKLAAEVGREVMTVPGSIGNPHNKGCHKPVKDSAKLMEYLNDIVRECPQLLQNSSLLPYAIKRDTSETRKPEPPTTVGKSSENVGTEAGRRATSSPLLDTMGYGPIHPDMPAQQLQSPATDAYAGLLELEPDGKIASLAGGRYQRIETQK